MKLEVEEAAHSVSPIHARREEATPITPPRKTAPGMYNCLVEYHRKPYSVTWSGSAEYPDFKTFSANSNFSMLPQSHEMARLWASSTVLDFGAHASIRTSIPPRNGNSGLDLEDCFPISKLAHSDAESLALIQNEIRILSDPVMRTLPTVKIDEQPIMDHGVVVGFRMKTLAKLDMGEFYSRKVEIQKALEQLHKSGFCHGDFSPSNVMTDGHGQITLIDLSHAGRIGEAIPLLIKRQGYSGDVFSADQDWEAFQRFTQRP